MVAAVGYFIWSPDGKMPVGYAAGVPLLPLADGFVGRGSRAWIRQGRL